MSLQREEQDDSRQSCCQSPVDQEGKCYGGLGEATVMSWAVILPFVRYEAYRQLLPPPLMPKEFSHFCTCSPNYMLPGSTRHTNVTSTLGHRLCFRAFLESGVTEWFLVNIPNMRWFWSCSVGFFLVKVVLFPSSAVQGSGSGFLCLQTILSIRALI